MEIFMMCKISDSKKILSVSYVSDLIKINVKMQIRCVRRLQTLKLTNIRLGKKAKRMSPT